MEGVGGCRCLSTAILAIASPLYLSSAHSTIRQAAIMAEGMFYNVTAGYIEGIVRGYRNNLLTGQNYGNLTQCETIDGMEAPNPAVLCYVSIINTDYTPDVKLQLGPAYGDYLASLPPNPSTSALADKAMDKLSTLR